LTRRRQDPKRNYEKHHEATSSRAPKHQEGRRDRAKKADHLEAAQENSHRSRQASQQGQTTATSAIPLMDAAGLGDDLDVRDF
jgi:hypothetical protein